MDNNINLEALEGINIDEVVSGAEKIATTARTTVSWYRRKPVYCCAWMAGSSLSILLPEIRRSRRPLRPSS